MKGSDLTYDLKLIEGTLPKQASAAVLFIDVLGIWRRNVRRVAFIGTAAAVTTAAVVTAGAAQANAAAASAAAAAAARPPTVNVQVTTPAPVAVPATTQKLEQLKGLLKEGLITQAQYDKSSQEVLNELVK
jgi:hypothetical protein